jgi:hypothetical protein
MVDAEATISAAAPDRGSRQSLWPVTAAFCFLFLSAAALLLLRATRPRSAALVDLVNWALALLPVLLLFIVLQPSSADNNDGTQWRATLASLRFRLPPDEALHLGGEALQNHLVVERMPDRLLALTSDKSEPGSRQWELTPWTLRGGGIVVVSSSARDESQSHGLANESVLGGIAMPSGTEWCVAGEGGVCASEKRLRWDLEDDVAVLTAVGNEESPVRLCSIRRPPGRAESTQVKVIFPLAHYARADCTGTELFSWAPGLAATEFVYWIKGSEDLFIRPAVNRPLLLATPGKTPTRTAPIPPLREGERRHVKIWQITPADRLPLNPARNDDEPADEEYTRAQERRSFSLEYAKPDSSLSVKSSPVMDRTRAAELTAFLDTPQSVTASPGDPLKLTIASRADGPAQIPEGFTAISFPLIGAKTAADLMNFIQHPSSSTRNTACADGDRDLIVRNMTTLSCARVGRWFALGDPQGFQIEMRLAPIYTPTGWMAALCLLVFANLLVRHVLGVPTLARVVLAFLEMLLTLRLAVAFDAAAVDARQEPTVAAAWIALLWLPLAFEIVPPAIGDWRRVVAARVGKLAVVVGGTYVIAQTVGLPPFGDSGQALIVSLGICLVVAVLTRGGNLLDGLATRALNRFSEPLSATVPLLALALIHLAAASIGVREQIGNFRTSAVLVPTLVLAWGYLFNVVRSRTEISRSQLVLCLIAAFLPMAGFAVARDNGAILYFMGLAVWLTLTAWPASRIEWTQWGLSFVAMTALFMTLISFIAEPLHSVRLGSLLAFALAVGVLLMFCRKPMPSSRTIGSAPALVVLAALMAFPLVSALMPGAPEEEAADPPTLEDVKRLADLSTNDIRLMHLISPSLVENLGIRDGYEQRAALAEMYRYSAEPAGKGLPQVSLVPRALIDTHIDDTVTAVHVMSPFGRAGGFALGVFLIAFAAAVLAATREDSGVRGIAAQIAAIVIAVTSLYMLLANVGLTPFTGRNFYFLAVASGSDLLEGGLLLALIVGARKGWQT